MTDAASFAVISVVWVAATIYAGYKSIQLWSRLVGDARKEERYRRQDGCAARSLYRSAVRLQGMLIKACQFIATRADVLPNALVDTRASAGRSPVIVVCGPGGTGVSTVAMALLHSIAAEAYPMLAGQPGGRRGL